ncbi:hypothetical protein [Streptomyces sp. TRM68416]|uniref:hypothetical protein n=1 Tax=Streptomyces sp. TRM68416 TaxID=2758412 RepID=UPI001661A288|nr:hypothetical protein [Streptomyces sp. TRM68416]MBD0842748.1 hypothetical protein [Streptomyces sp. TRM68416]
MSRSRHLLAAVVTALLLPVSTAAAATPSPGEHIAQALATTPVYVDDAYASAVPPAERRRLVRQIEKTDLPIKVVLTPLTKGDAFDGEADTLAAVLRDRLPQRELILITTDGSYTASLNGYEWPADTHQTRDAVAAVGFMDELRHAGLAARTAKAVELVAEGDGTAAYEEATSDLREPATDSDAPGDKAGTPWQQRGWGWGWAIAASALGTLLVLVVRRRRRKAPPPRSPFAHPQAVFAAARAADEAALRRRAEAEVLALGEAARSADTATTPGLQRALDAYAAASAVLDTAGTLPDLAGVLALVTEGRDALTATTPSPLPLCFFNPLHGRATHRTTWRPLGRRDKTPIASCTPCTHALRTHRAPEVLTTTSPSGTPIPYFELPADQSVWAATGYGSLLRGGDSLAARVGRRGLLAEWAGGEAGHRRS